MKSMVVRFVSAWRSLLAGSRRSSMRSMRLSQRTQWNRGSVSLQSKWILILLACICASSVCSVATADDDRLPIEWVMREVQARYEAVDPPNGSNNQKWPDCADPCGTAPSTDFRYPADFAYGDLDDEMGVCLTTTIVNRLGSTLGSNAWIDDQWAEAMTSHESFFPETLSVSSFPAYAYLVNVVGIDEENWKDVCWLVMGEVLPRMTYLNASSLVEMSWHSWSSTVGGYPSNIDCDSCDALCEEPFGLVIAAIQSGGDGSASSGTGLVTYIAAKGVNWACSSVGACSGGEENAFSMVGGDFGVRGGTLQYPPHPLENDVLTSTFLVYAKAIERPDGVCDNMPSPIGTVTNEEYIEGTPFKFLVSLVPDEQSADYADYSFPGDFWDCGNRPQAEGFSCGWEMTDIVALRKLEFIPRENCTQCGDSEEVPTQANDEASNPVSDDDEGCDRSSHPESDHPVIMSTGFKSERAVDFTVDAVGQTFSFVREYTSNPNLGGAKLLGENWMASCFRFISVQTEDPKDPDEDAEITMTAPPVERKLVFEPDGMNQKWSAGGPTTRYMEKSTVTIDDETWPVWQLVEPGQYIMKFFRQPDEAESALDEPPLPFLGLLAQEEDWYGNKRVYQYLLAGAGEDDDLKAARLCCIYLNGSPESEERADAEIHFQWNLTDDPDLFGTLSRISVQRPKALTETHQVRFVYGATAGETVHADVGSGKELVQVTVRERINPPGGSGPVWRTRITQYRYHDGEEPGSNEDERFEVDGPQHSLKAVIMPEQIEYYAQKRSAYESWNADAPLRPRDMAEPRRHQHQRRLPVRERSDHAGTVHLPQARPCKENFLRHL